MSLVQTAIGTIAPSLRDQIARSFGVNTNVVDHSIQLVAALVLDGLARKGSTADGANAIVASIATHRHEGFIEMLRNAFSGEIPSTPADQLQGIFGAGVNGMAAFLSKRLGLNVAPLLGLLTPAVTGALAQRMKADALDPAGVGELLKREREAFMADPAHAELVPLLNEAHAAGERSAALRGAYSAAEWKAIHLGAASAFVLVGDASDSGFSGSFREMVAVASALADAVKECDPGSLIATAFGTGLTRDELVTLKLEGTAPGTLLERAREGYEIVKRKAPSEAAMYKQLVLGVGHKVAAASKEGGFLGIGGKLVTEAEEKALNLLAGAFA
jgi:hypothetical protein